MSYRTIKLKRYNDIVNEYPAAGEILPGSLVVLNSDGKVAVNATAGAKVATMFALEDELQGKSTRDAYAADDPVQAWFVTPGEEVLARVGSSVTPAIGALMEAATGGNLRIHDEGEPLFEVVGPKIIDDGDNHRVPVRRI